MPKNQDHEASKSMKLLDRIQISLVTPSNLDVAACAQLNHDIKASHQSFALLIEEIEMSFSRPPSARQQTKATQLRDHLETHRKISILFCNQLMKAADIALLEHGIKTKKHGE
jgi:hypothetical protein